MLEVNFMKKKFFDISKLSGKGLIIAVSACILAVGGAGVYSYYKISDKLSADLIGETGAALSADSDEPVNAGQTNIAKPEARPPAETAAPAQTAAAGDAASNISPAIPEIANRDEAGEEKPPEENVDGTPAIAPQVMVRPINGEVVNEFSNGELVKSKTLNVWKTHDGVDIAGKLDEKVKSMTSGTVSKVYNDQLMGVSVIIDHGNGLEGHYCNLSADVPIAEGGTVSAGTVIGAIGESAESEVGEGPHLHFAVKKDGEWIDPITLISSAGS